MDETNILLNYGKNYFKLEKYDKALECYQNLLSKDNNSISTNYMIGRCYLGLKNDKEARKYLQIAAGGSKKEDLEYVNWAIRYLKSTEPRK